MQKHASKIKNFYETVFTPLPTKDGSQLYFDKNTVVLPYAEDFPRLHYHDRYEIGLCVSGEGLFLSEGKFHPLSKGDVIFVHPGCKHYSRSFHEDALCYCRFIYLSPDSVNTALSILNEHERKTVLEHAKRIPTVLRSSEYPAAVAALQTFVNGCLEQETYRVALGALRLSAFLLEARNWFPDKVDSAIEWEGTSRTPCAEANQIAEYFSLHYFESKSSKELAKMCHLSESQLRRQFMHAYGRSPIAYRNVLRCRIASELLIRTDLSISEISEQIGYSSSSDFYRQFQKQFGLSPSEYRKQN